MLRIPRSFLTINNIGHAWDLDDTREFLDALYRDNTDAIVRAGARSARYHDQHRRPFPLLKEGDKVIYKAALGGYFAAMSGVDAAATKLKFLLPGKGPTSHIVAHPTPTNVYEVDPHAARGSTGALTRRPCARAGDLHCDKPPPVHVGRGGVKYAVDGDITDHKKRGPERRTSSSSGSVLAGHRHGSRWPTFATFTSWSVSRYFKGKVPAR
jgi:hypothetical protein